MKNKLYKAFDSIKLDAKVKEKAYQCTMVTREKKVNKYVYRSLCVAFTVCLVILMMPKNNDIPINSDDLSSDGKTVEMQNIENYVQDIIRYDNHNYTLTDLNANNITIGKKIGILKQIDSLTALKNDFDAYAHDGYEVYNSSEKDILIAKSSDNLLIYKIQEKE